MHFRSAGFIVALIVLSISGASCGSYGGTGNMNSANATNQAAANSNAAGSNVEELGLLVNIPFETEDIVWKQHAANKSVVAVMLLTPQNAERLVNEATALRSPEPVIISSETWFPAELIAQSGISSDDNLKGNAYAANSFFQEPYTNGRIIRIENTDYFVLELNAK